MKFSLIKIPESKTTLKGQIYPSLDETASFLPKTATASPQRSPLQSSPSSKSRFQIPEDSGILAQPEYLSSKALKISRIINLIEPIITFMSMMGVVWLTMLDLQNKWLYIGLGIIFTWVLLFSPLFHYYILQEGNIFLPSKYRSFAFWCFNVRGFGNCLQYYGKDVKGRRAFQKYYKTICVLIIALDVLLIGFVFQNYVDYALIVEKVCGCKDDWVLVCVFWGGLLPLFDLVLFFGVFPVMLRCDNFESGMREFYGNIALIGFCLIPVFAVFFQLLWGVFEKLPDDSNWKLIGDKPFKRFYDFRVVGYFSQWFTYVLWGYLQQVLFLGSFSSMFSRAFDIQNNNYGHYIANFCSAVLFGAVHYPTHFLSIATFIFGYLWSRTFMQVRSLMVLGINHGMLGTATNQLLPIVFTVGPPHFYLWWFFGFNII